MCIARATALQPDALLMDEPCSALDPISTLAIEELMSQLEATYTIVIVTHNMQRARRTSDSTGFFNLDGAGQPGRLVETEQTFSDPKDHATKRYVSGRPGWAWVAGTAAPHTRGCSDLRVRAGPARRMSDERWLGSATRTRTDDAAAAGQIERLRTSQNVRPSRASETRTNQLSSIHWKVQYRLSGW